MWGCDAMGRGGVADNDMTGTVSAAAAVSTRSIEEEDFQRYMNMTFPTDMHAALLSRWQLSIA
jgi:hypothetical protein